MDRTQITATLVARLVSAQFPRWAAQPAEPDVAAQRRVIARITADHASA